MACSIYDIRIVAKNIAMYRCIVADLLLLHYPIVPSLLFLLSPCINSKWCVSVILHPSPPLSYCSFIALPPPSLSMYEFKVVFLLLRPIYHCYQVVLWLSETVLRSYASLKAKRVLTFCLITVMENEINSIL